MVLGLCVVVGTVVVPGLLVEPAPAVVLGTAVELGEVDGAVELDSWELGVEMTNAEVVDTTELDVDEGVTVLEISSEQGSVLEIWVLEIWVLEIWVVDGTGVDVPALDVTAVEVLGMDAPGVEDPGVELPSGVVDVAIFEEETLSVHGSVVDTPEGITVEDEATGVDPGQEPAPPVQGPVMEGLELGEAGVVEASGVDDTGVGRVEDDVP